jgi:predicted GNAT superfamily acetyltransferase
MNDPQIELSLATSDDIADIVDLQERNLRIRGGTLSVPFSGEWFETAIAEMPIIVARRDGRLAGYLVSSTLAAQAHVPIIQSMMQAYPGSPCAYNYGPVCVAESERGRGVARAMYQELRKRLPGREGVTFIRRDNTVSVKVHTKMGMRKTAEFTQDDVAFIVCAFR